MEFEIKGKKYVLREEDEGEFEQLLTLISKLGDDGKYYIEGRLIRSVKMILLYEMVDYLSNLFKKA